MLDPQHYEKMSIFVHTVCLPRLETHFKQRLLAVTEAGSKLQFLIKKGETFAAVCFQFLFIRTLDPDPHPNF
jgi:hypothetical protein